LGLNFISVGGEFIQLISSIIFICDRMHNIINNFSHFHKMVAFVER
jgi:hypothetical protein